VSKAIREELHEVERDALRAVADAADLRALDEVRVRYLGKKGRLTCLLRSVSALPAADRPSAGSLVNKAKEQIQSAIGDREAALSTRIRERQLTQALVDVTLPAYGPAPGHPHPLVRTMAEVTATLTSLGFTIAEGPEIEDDYHNFEALNIPADHPARDMQDTFFVTGGLVLRTHTSPVQIRVMESRQPPLAIIAPGVVYRHDDDVTHSPMFHQIEGLMVDERTSFAHLKYVLTTFLRRIFGEETPVRFRPSYFPFTEPSVEVDVGCGLCVAGRNREACRVCKGTGWLEILGAGMVHPAVFEKVGYDPERYTGFAFGLGIDRITMLRHGIDDIRLLYSNDLRFLRQF
jgi:phenylalanyl-tRNA synthetase alpha chain